MTQGYQDILWLAGQVFLVRDFVKTTDARSLETLLAECPYGDLSDEQRAGFQAAFHNPRLRQVVEQWWVAYDAARAAGELSGQAYWED
jgi:hypothetical protein